MEAPLLAILLHAHLPFVRHPEHPEFLEERWLFEAMVECYLPMLRVLDGWERDGVVGVLNLTVSPALAAMLSDHLLCRRFEAHLAQLEELAGREEDRHTLQPGLARVARHYRERLAGVREVWLVEPEFNTVTVYQSPTRNVILTEEEELTSAVLPDFRCDLREIFSSPVKP